MKIIEISKNQNSKVILELEATPEEIVNLVNLIEE